MLVAEQGKIRAYLNSSEDAEILTGLADDVRDAMTEYQVCTQASSA